MTRTITASHGIWADETSGTAWTSSESTTNISTGTWAMDVNIESPEVTELKTRVDVLEKELLFIKSSLMGDEDGKNPDLYFRKIDFK